MGSMCKEGTQVPGKEKRGVTQDAWGRKAREEEERTGLWLVVREMDPTRLNS